MFHDTTKDGNSNNDSTSVLRSLANQADRQKDAGTRAAADHQAARVASVVEPIAQAFMRDELPKLDGYLHEHASRGCRSATIVSEKYWPEGKRHVESLVKVVEPEGLPHERWGWPPLLKRTIELMQKACQERGLKTEVFAPYLISPGYRDGNVRLRVIW
jgi:hypothetical protein